MLEHGYEQFKQGEFERAVEAFTTCLAMSPDPQAFRGRAAARFQLKQWSKAASDFTRAAELDPNDTEILLGLGTCLAMENKIYEAIQAFETLLQKEPRHVRGHIQLGLLHYKLCATAKGREHIEAALAGRPSLEERRMIDQILKEQKDLDKNRYYRPDFEALRKAGGTGTSHSWLKKLQNSLQEIICRVRPGKAKK